jgi:hypothetical protein
MVEQFSFGIFGKKNSNQILVLLGKPCHFSEKKSQKSGYTLDY